MSSFLVIYGFCKMRFTGDLRALLTLFLFLFSQRYFDKNVFIDLEISKHYSNG